MRDMVPSTPVAPKINTCDTIMLIDLVQCIQQNNNPLISMTRSPFIHHWTEYKVSTFTLFFYHQSLRPHSHIASIVTSYMKFFSLSSTVKSLNILRNKNNLVDCTMLTATSESTSRQDEVNPLIWLATQGPSCPRNISHIGLARQSYPFGHLIDPLFDQVCSVNLTGY